MNAPPRPRFLGGLCALRREDVAEQLPALALEAGQLHRLDRVIVGRTGRDGDTRQQHGVSGDNEQYKYPPAPVLRRFESAGWDVVKINRNNLYEHGWTSSGVRHRDDAIERARAAKASGYKSVILAGQSYGGAISLEANAKAAGIDGVMALSPGHEPRKQE